LRETSEYKKEEGKVIYKESYGVLKMTNPKDHVLVMGDFVMQNYYQTKDSKVLSDGVLEIKGDFTQIACGVTPSFYACENHKVILSGEGQQIITMEESNSRFNELILINPIEDGNYIFIPEGRTFWNSLEIDLDYNQSKKRKMIL